MNSKITTSDEVANRSMTSRFGFTLVELLVVIGIIAVLISLLLPALNKAREAANVAACMSNMRSLGQAAMIYQSQYNGAFPPPWTFCKNNGSSPPSLHNNYNSIDNTTPKLWDLMPLPLASTVRVCPSVYNQLQIPTYNPTTQGIYSYRYSDIVAGANVTQEGNFGCQWPNFSSDKTIWGVNAVTTGHPMYRTTTDDWIPQPLKFVKNGTETILFGDYPQIIVFDTTNNVNYNGASDRWKLTPPANPYIQSDGHQAVANTAPVHSVGPSTGVPNQTFGSSPIYKSTQGTINVCFCDGHVDSILVKQGAYNNTRTTDYQTQNSWPNVYTIMPSNPTVWSGCRLDPNQAP